MTDDFVITPNPSQQARYRTRCGFPSELCPPGSAAIDLKRRKTHLLRRAISGRHPDVLEGIDQPIESRSPSGVSQIVIRRMWVGSGLSWRGFPRSVACNSATQIDDLVEAVTPFAIGMADNIDDGDAINYAAQFYAAVAYGARTRRIGWGRTTDPGMGT
jgi:hypothetical protein